MPSQSMRDDLFALFASPPSVFSEHVLGKKHPSKEEAEQVRQYVDRHRLMLVDAKHFVVDLDAYNLLRALLAEIGEDGLTDTFQHAVFPFSTILIEGGDGIEASASCLIVEAETGFYSECFIKAPGGIAPNAKVLFWGGPQADILSSPFDQSIARGSNGQIDQELKLNGELCGLFIALCTLLRYDDMLSTEETPLYSRGDRRRAEKSGNPLPDARKIVVKLGKLGRAQSEAMGLDKAAEKSATRRAHWVRGHFMRNPSGGLSWRIPHIRGVGKPTDQTRVFRSNKGAK